MTDHSMCFSFFFFSFFFFMRASKGITWGRAGSEYERFIYAWRQKRVKAGEKCTCADAQVIE